MLIPKDALITAAFMMEGMCDSQIAYDKALRRWDRGCFELISEMVQYAQLSELLVEEADKFMTEHNESFPGVYDYEVSEPFGRWFRNYVIEHKDAPSDKLAKTYLHNLFANFFIHGDADTDFTEMINTTREIRDAWSPSA